MELFRSVRRNKRKSYTIIIFVMGLLAAALYSFLEVYIGYKGNTELVVAVIIGILTMVSYLSLTKAVLAINGAVPLSEENKDLYGILEGLSIAAGVPVPKLYQINDSAMNAFATGKNPENGYICLTTGLINVLERDEIEAVMAHELSHIKNYDTLFATVMALYVGIIVLIGDIARHSRFISSSDDDEDNGGGAIVAIIMVLVAVVGGIGAQLLNLSFSRQREFLADARAVEFTRNPGALISALRKISGDTNTLNRANNSTAPMYIVNPFKKVGAKKNKSSVWSTHPSIDERVEALEKFD